MGRFCSRKHRVAWVYREWAYRIGPRRCERFLERENSSEVRLIPNLDHCAMSNAFVSRRIGGLEEMQGVYLYLASDASSFATGTDVVVDGGYRLW